MPLYLARCLLRGGQRGRYKDSRKHHLRQARQQQLNASAAHCVMIFDDSAAQKICPRWQTGRRERWSEVAEIRQRWRSRASRHPPHTTYATSPPTVRYAFFPAPQILDGDVCAALPRIRQRTNSRPKECQRSIYAASTMEKICAGAIDAYSNQSRPDGVSYTAF